MEHDQEKISFSHALSLFTDEQYPFAYIEKKSSIDHTCKLYLTDDTSSYNFDSINLKKNQYFGYISFEGVETFFNVKKAYQFDFEFNNTLKALDIKNVHQKDEWDKYLTESKEFFEKYTNLKKIVLHRRVDLFFGKNLKIDELLKSLPQINPNQHFFIFKNFEEYYISYSPETLINVFENELHTMSLAGTFPRSDDFKKDQELEDTLLHDKKNVLEQKIVTDNIIRDLEKYCTEIKSSAPYIFKQKHVQHIATDIIAQIKRSDVFKLIRKLHPTPALNGEPKELASKIILEIEKIPRNYYGGAFGILNNKRLHLIVGIRSFFFKNHSSSVTLFGGCGILPESNALDEWNETLNKMNSFIKHFNNNAKVN